MVFKNEIAIGGCKYLIIDLTEPLSEKTEVYPGDPKPLKNIAAEFEDSGYRSYSLNFGDHNSRPHCDAPNHQNQELESDGVEVFDIRYCFNNACLIDLSCCAESEVFDGIKYLVNVKRKHLEPFSKAISSNSALVLRTGYDKWLEDNRPHVPGRIPYLDEGAADFISSFKSLKVLGVDSLTVDPQGGHYAHKRLKGLMIVESMVHLGMVPKKARDCFLLQTSPVRFKGATGCPVVAYAFVRI